MLRWVTPIKNMARTATRDVELRGETIRAARRCCCSTTRQTATSASSTSRSASSPTGSRTTTSPSAATARTSARRELARLELRVMFEELLRALPDVELESATTLALRPSNFIVGIEQMPIVFAPRALA